MKHRRRREPVLPWLLAAALVASAGGLGVRLGADGERRTDRQAVWRDPAGAGHLWTEPPQPSTEVVDNQLHHGNPPQEAKSQMSEIQTYQPQGNSLPAKIQYAQTLADSGLLPMHYRKQPANVLYAVEYGEMLGLSPMAAITGIHVIEGKPSASAGLMSALVRRAGHRLRVTVSYDKQNLPVATAEIVRCDDPDFTYRATWDVPRAVRAGLCTIKDGRPYARSQKDKDKALSWEKYPEAMVKARAISEVARDACEEALSGVHYTPEELGAQVDAEGQVITAVQERPPADDIHDAEMVEDRSDSATDQDWLAHIAERIDAADEVSVLRGLWAEVTVQREAGECSQADHDHLKKVITERSEALKRPAPEGEAGAA